MTPSAKILIGACLLLLGGLGASAAFAVAAFHRAGTLTVEVHEPHGDDVSVRLPAALINLAPVLVLREACREIPAGAWRYVDLARAVASSSKTCPTRRWSRSKGPTST